jgi:thioredoxin 1
MNIAIIIIVSVVIIIGVYFYTAYRKMKNMPAVKDHEKIKTLTEQNFQSQIKSGVTLVDFWAAWCMPCKMIAPTLNSVAKEISGNAAIGKLNIEQNQAVASKYRVRSIPTLIMFKNGKEISRFSGIKTKDFILSEIRKIQ